MASDYGLHFGFRRSDESLRVAEGRFRTPATGTALLIGSCVEIDPAAPGYLRVAAANALPRTGICGLLLQEEDWDVSIYAADNFDSYGKGTAKKNRLSVVTNGSGGKVWFDNRAAITRADGRVLPAVSIVEFVGGLAVGDKLGWNGTKWAKTIVAGQDHFELTEVNTAKEYVEAVFTK